MQVLKCQLSWLEQTLFQRINLGSTCRNTPKYMECFNKFLDFAFANSGEGEDYMPMSEMQL